MFVIRKEKYRCAYTESTKIKSSWNFDVLTPQEKTINHIVNCNFPAHEVVNSNTKTQKYKHMTRQIIKSCQCAEANGQML